MLYDFAAAPPASRRKGFPLRPWRKGPLQLALYKPPQSSWLSLGILAMQVQSGVLGGVLEARLTCKCCKYGIPISSLTLILYPVPIRLGSCPHLSN